MTKQQVTVCGEWQSSPTDQMGVATCEQLFCKAGETIGRNYVADDRAVITLSFLENESILFFKEKRNKQQKSELQANVSLSQVL